MKYRIRFNKTRGQPGRGTLDHVWRVFDSTGKEWIVKHVQLMVPSFGDKEEGSDDWNMVCFGVLKIDKETSTALIVES